MSRRDFRGESGPVVIRIMKYVILLLILAFIVLLLLYASGSSKPFQEVEAAVSQALDKSEPTEQEPSSFKRNFGLNAADYSGVMYYSSEAAISAEEVLLVRVNSEDQIQEVRDAIEEWIQSKKEDFDGYAPEEVKLLEDARQSVRGKYIFFAASSKADEYLDVFNRNL